MIGGFLEGLAIFVAQKAYGAHGKSIGTAMDLELDKNGKRYFVTIKSGPNWGNSRQIAKMRDDFNAAKRIYRQNSNALPVECVNGCCYGRQSRKREDQGDYVKLCGQRFWEFISGDPELYIKIVDPIGHKAREHNEEFLKQYEEVVGRFTEVFREQFCDKDDRIQWDKVTKLACEAPAPKPTQASSN